MACPMKAKAAICAAIKIAVVAALSRLFYRGYLPAVKQQTVDMLSLMVVGFGIQLAY